MRHAVLSNSIATSRVRQVPNVAIEDGATLPASDSLELACV